MPIPGTDLWQWRTQAKQQAIAAQIPPSEVDWLLQSAGLDRLSLRLGSFKDPTLTLKYSLPELEQIWHTRIHTRSPLQYLVGETPWRNFLLTVSPAVLIPRPETEELVDIALASAQAHPTLTRGHWADLGTGSGAIALALAEALPQATVHAVDISEAALDIARQNSDRLRLSVQFHHGKWLEPLAFLKGKLSAMISNPPYIPQGLIADLQPEVADHEPQLALDGGEDGLDCIRHLVETAPNYLHSGGIWLIELMAGQAEIVAQLLQEQGHYQSIQIHPDLNQIERFVLATRI
jgi:release factor glutamine methyltransferase